MTWYDSGITVAAELAREVRWLKAEGFWPWGEPQPPYWVKPVPTLEQLNEMQKQPLPDLDSERKGITA